MLVKLDDGNVVLFSELIGIGINEVEADQVILMKKDSNNVRGWKHGDNEYGYKAAKEERDRLIGEWEAWLKGGEK